MITSSGIRPAGSHRRRIRIVAPLGLFAMLLLTAVTASTPPAAADAESEARACRSLAAGLPAPSPTGVRPGHASPRSPFSRGAPYVAPYPAATAAADTAARAGRTQTASRLTKIAQQPRGSWLTDPAASGTTDRVRGIVRAAYARSQVPVLVLYGIPLRDCGQYSSGGASSGRAYQAWAKAVAAGIRAAGTGPGVAVIMEPDALALLDRLPGERQTERLELLRAATTWLTAVSGVAVYLDAGHSRWVAPADMVRRLSLAGIAMARGFSLNVSNFGTTEDQLNYGLQLSPPLGWKGFVVDTGRNGRGPAPDDQWCNPRGRALGPAPQIGPGLVDAYLWVKPPGESDGACRAGAPPAGVFWPAYADDLARTAGW